jgi:hypothetical protein
MSGFGFSVGDIVLISQLAYRLYSAVTNSGTGRTKDLQELGDALFGLRCALDHLGQTWNDISARASSRGNSESEKMRRNLNMMIDSCASTLNELDTKTQKYRDIDVEGGIQDQNISGGGTSSTRQRTLERWRTLLKVQYTRINWDFKRVSLNEYRQKLQAHTSALNIVLCTFIWYVFCSVVHVCALCQN